MTTYIINDGEFDKLQNKVILVTGGAAGIGRAIVTLAHENGAKVAFCDVDEARGKQVEQELDANVFFKRCDVFDWDELLHFFQETVSKFGRIDTVIANAAINKLETLDEPIDDDLLHLKKPDLSVLNINIAATWYITKCAISFFRMHPEIPSQLVLFGSAASIWDTPPLYTYCASKGAVLGLMRSLRTQLPKMNISVNMIAPWMTGKRNGQGYSDPGYIQYGSDLKIPDTQKPKEARSTLSS
ncbi:Tropinone reductase-like 2 [Colletotrichum fructicola]|nr:Tropinone reductase-like 2 [Colletotrichum fructicola]